LLLVAICNETALVYASNSQKKKKMESEGLIPQEVSVDSVEKKTKRSKHSKGYRTRQPNSTTRSEGWKKELCG